jgi:hypothetical protein
MSQTLPGANKYLTVHLETRRTAAQLPLAAVHYVFSLSFLLQLPTLNKLCFIILLISVCCINAY